VPGCLVGLLVRLRHKGLGLPIQEYHVLANMLGRKAGGREAKFQDIPECQTIHLDLLLWWRPLAWAKAGVGSALSLSSGLRPSWLGVRKESLK
jgi:hypothetical protein